MPPTAAAAAAATTVGVAATFHFPFVSVSELASELVDCDRCSHLRRHFDIGILLRLSLATGAAAAASACALEKAQSSDDRKRTKVREGETSRMSCAATTFHCFVRRQLYTAPS